MTMDDKAPPLLLNPESARFVSTPTNTGPPTVLARGMRTARFKVIGLLDPRDMQAGREYTIIILPKHPKVKRPRRGKVSP